MKISLLILSTLIFSLSAFTGRAQMPPPSQPMMTLDPKTGVICKMDPTTASEACSVCANGLCNLSDPAGVVGKYSFANGIFSDATFVDFKNKRIFFPKIVFDMIKNAYVISVQSNVIAQLDYNIDLGVFYGTIIPTVINWTCGDGHFDPAVEECDASDPTYRAPAGFGCNQPECLLIPTLAGGSCGGILVAGGISSDCCAPGNICCLAGADFCFHQPHICGNNVIDTDLGETCDDGVGNGLPQDACDLDCHLIPPTPPPPPPPVTCYACDRSDICSVIPASMMSCGVFFSEPTCGGSCSLGTATVPSDADRALCTTSTSDLPAGTRVREYPDSTHISRCETGTSVRYIICGRSGDVTASVAECPTGDPCEDGTCVDTGATVSPFCVDTDLADDVHVRGSVVGVDSSGRGFAPFDFCFNDTHTIETFCNPDHTPGYSPSPGVACPTGEYCEGGVCIPSLSCTPTCVDTDPADDVHVRGGVGGVDSLCRPFAPSDDFCFNDTHTIETFCNPDNTVGFSPSPGVACPTGEHCEGGVCIPSLSCTPTCVDTDPADDVHVGGGVVGVDSLCRLIATSDFCHDDGHTVETFCNPDHTPGYSPSPGVACPTGEHCDLGRCLCGRTSCARTEATATMAGFVTGIDCIVQHDICDSSTVVTYTCGADGHPAEGARITCLAGCMEGVCR